MASPTTTDLATARGHFERALGDLLSVGEATLDAPWDWAGHGEVDRRYGFFRILEDLDATTARLDAVGGGRPVHEAIVAPATVARWELNGLVATLTEADLDADPGRGEWTVRQTIAHIIGSQHGYAVYNDWWRQQAIRTSEESLPYAPDGLDDPAWDEAIAAHGTPDDIRGRLHVVVDDAAALTSDLTDDDLALVARWSGLPVTLAFRQGRWASHITEHTVQVDKTLMWLGRQPSEVERLVRQLSAAWGRLEARVWPRARDEGAVAIAVDAARRAAETAASVRAAKPA